MHSSILLTPSLSWSFLRSSMASDGSVSTQRKSVRLPMDVSKVNKTSASTLINLTYGTKMIEKSSLWSWMLFHLQLASLRTTEKISSWILDKNKPNSNSKRERKNRIHARTILIVEMTIMAQLDKLEKPFLR